MIARSTPWGTIRKGEDFWLLTTAEQHAVIWHECGHIHHRHALKRIWWLLTLLPFRDPVAYWVRCANQEFEADRYAADCGFADGLITFLMRKSSSIKSPGYPSNAERIEALYE